MIFFSKQSIRRYLGRTVLNTLSSTSQMRAFWEVSHEHQAASQKNMLKKQGVMLTRSASQSSPQTIAKRSMKSRSPPPSTRVVLHYVHNEPNPALPDGTPTKLKPLSSTSVSRIPSPVLGSSTSVSSLPSPVLGMGSPSPVLGMGSLSFQDYWDRKNKEPQLLGSVSDWCSPNKKVGLR